MKPMLASVLLAVAAIGGCSDSLADNERRHRLLTHCGLSFPMRYESRNWLPVDEELRKNSNPPPGFSSADYFDEDVVREVDEDTLIYVSSGGEEVEYEPTQKQRGGCE